MTENFFYMIWKPTLYFRTLWIALICMWWSGNSPPHPYVYVIIRLTWVVTFPVVLEQSVCVCSMNFVKDISLATGLVSPAVLMTTAIQTFLSCETTLVKWTLAWQLWMTWVFIMLAYRTVVMQWHSTTVIRIATLMIKYKEQNNQWIWCWLIWVNGNK